MCHRGGPLAVPWWLCWAPPPKNNLGRCCRGDLDDVLAMMSPSRLCPQGHLCPSLRGQQSLGPAQPEEQGGLWPPHCPGPILGG